MKTSIESTPESFTWNYWKDRKLIEEDKYSKYKYSSVCEKIKIEKFIASVQVAV